MTQDTGGPAFPTPEIHDKHPWGESQLCRHERAEQGMTLRDYFAAKALPSVIDTFAFGNADPTDYAKGIAEGCYEIADEMLKARSK
jgi:hypothetical protein